MTFGLRLGDLGENLRFTLDWTPPEQSRKQGGSVSTMGTSTDLSPGRGGQDEDTAVTGKEVVATHSGQVAATRSGQGGVRGESVTV